MQIIGALVVAGVPMVAIVGLLWLTERVRARREVGRCLQIMVTDAVHGALGAVAAPRVTRRVGGGWRVEMRLPPGRPELAAALVRVAEDVMGQATRGSGRPFEIVLIAADGMRAAGRGAHALGRHPETAAPLTAAAR